MSSPSYPILPADLEYQIIFEFATADINPHKIIEVFPNLKERYINRAVHRAFKHFNDASPASLTKVAWHKAVEKMGQQSAPEAIIKYALEILTKSLPDNKKLDIENKWGPYSITTGKIDEIEQTIKDISLELIWGKTKKTLIDLGASNLPSSPNEIRSWLEDPANNRYTDNVTSIILRDSNLFLIPSEIKYFKNLEILDLRNNKIKKITGINTLLHLIYLELTDNEIEDISPLKANVNLRYLFMVNNNIKNINDLNNAARLTIFLHDDIW